MKFYWIIILCLIFLLPTLPVRAEESITFTDSISTMGNPIPSIIFWRDYQVYAEQGTTLTLTLDASGWCNCRIGGGNLFANDVLIGQFSLVSLPTPTNITFTHQFVFQYLVPPTGEVLLRIDLYAGYSGFGSPPETITMNYTLTVNGVSNPTHLLEQAAGVQRVGTDPSLPVVIYMPTPDAHQKGNLYIDIWQLDGHNVGYPALYISSDELLALPDFPRENTLIVRDGFIRVYKLTTGEYQVNIGPLPDGKVHVIIFDGIPPTHTYGYTWSPTSD
ncbi:MAG: hypothetical protein K8L91_22805 [Anaerolineae bacterium]|nr:hypothetical protein [Anaerolineae bacterium]